MGRFLLLSMFLFSWAVNSQTVTCPEIAEPNQSFCESMGDGNDFHKPRIADLLAFDEGDGVVWYETADSNEPLSADQLLVDGGIYFADNNLGNCASRPSVSVSILDSPKAGATTFFTICSSADPIDLLSVYRPSLNGEPDSGGTFSPLLASGTTIFDPGVDLSGRYKYTVQSTTSCPADYSYIYISIESAPNAGENGTATVSLIDGPVDLFNYLNGSPQEGGSWSPDLASGSGIFDPSVDAPGEYKYTISGTQFCEEASAVVSVQMQSDPIFLCPEVTEASQSFCKSLGVGNDFHKPRISDLSASDKGGGLVWYETAESQEPLSPATLLIDGETYFADNNLGNCSSRPSVEVTILDSPKAGATTFFTICSSAGPVDLLDVYRPSLNGPPDPGGTFTPALASGTTIFDPMVDSGGRYKYTVQSTTSCPADESLIYITIETAPFAGNDGSITIRKKDDPIDLFEYLLDIPDMGGVWTPALNSGTGIFDPQIDQPGVYTYTVYGGAYCDDDSATVTVDVTSSNNSDDLIYVCHRSNTMAIASKALQMHLDHGDNIGKCNNNQNEIQVVVYPNPSSDIFKFEIKNIGEIKNIKVFNYSGVVMFNESFNAGRSQEINLSSLSPGIYLADVNTSQGRYIERIIKR